MRTGLAAAVAALTLPSDAYTNRDKRTDTGVRLNLRRADLPRNKSGTPINPADITRAGGFSPGSALLLKVPGLDTAAAVRQSKLPPLTQKSEFLEVGGRVVDVCGGAPCHAVP